MLAVFTARERALVEQDNYEMARLVACRRLRNDGWTLASIGKVFGLSAERVRQLLAG